MGSEHLLMSEEEVRVMPQGMGILCLGEQYMLVNVGNW